MVRDIKHNKNTLKEQQEKEFIKKMEHIERNVPSVFLIIFFKSVLIIKSWWGCLSWKVDLRNKIFVLVIPIIF